MKEKEFMERYLYSFSTAMNDVEALEAFLYRSQKTANEYDAQLQADYAVGIKIGQLFNDVMNCDTIESRNQKIEDIKTVLVDDSLKLEEICDILPVKDLEQPLQYVMKEYYWKLKYSPSEANKKKRNVFLYRFILIESVLSHIVIVFENFLSSVLGVLIAKNAPRYIGNETITFAELIKNQNAIETKIETVIDAKLRDSLELLKEITTKENLKIERYEKILHTFEEIYYRRNAYVHTRGCANRDYLKNVGEEYAKNIKKGDRLDCDEEYLKNSIQTLIKLIFYITFELLKNEAAGIDEIKEIADYFFDRLCKKDYEITKRIYYALSRYDRLVFADKTMYLINYINSCKQMGDFHTVKKELRGLDTSAMEQKYVIAKCCLEDNTEKILELLNKTYPQSYGATEIRDWPIFINFRETEEYKQFQSEHADDFAVQEMAAEKTNFVKMVDDCSANDSGDQEENL